MYKESVLPLTRFSHCVIQCKKTYHLLNQSLILLLFLYIEVLKWYFSPYKLVTLFNCTGIFLKYPFTLPIQQLVRFFKGIVSRNSEVCFLVPFDRSEVATPDGLCSFAFKISISYRTFGFSRLGVDSLLCEWSLALILSTAWHSLVLGSH
jgi:hypothetical protein